MLRCVWFFALLLLLGCTRESSSSDSVQPSSAKLDTDEKQAVVQNYAELVHQSYLRTLQEAQALQKAVAGLVAEPSETTLAGARTAWLQARVPYGETEAFRFYGGPIDDDDGPEGRLNAWPMDESYVDYVEGQPAAGMIQRVEEFPELSRERLNELNERDGEANICTGYHTIEFLLWGQDLSDEGPGTRPASDFVTQGNDPQEPARRRGQMLVTLTDLLVDELELLVAEWAPSQNENYRAKFVRDDQAVTHILTGIGSLSGAELAGERMAVALATGAREEEQSCFSDSTKQDHIANAQSILNVYLGSYLNSAGEAISGKGIYHLIQAQEPELADRARSEMEASLQACRNLPDPFEVVLVQEEGRNQLQTAITKLRTQTKTIVEIADRLGIRLNLEE